MNKSCHTTCLKKLEKIYCPHTGHLLKQDTDCPSCPFRFNARHVANYNLAKMEYAKGNHVTAYAFLQKIDGTRYHGVNYGKYRCLKKAGQIVCGNRYLLRSCWHGYEPALAALAEQVKMPVERKSLLFNAFRNKDHNAWNKLAKHLVANTNNYRGVCLACNRVGRFAGQGDCDSMQAARDLAVMLRDNCNKIKCSAPVLH